MSQKHSTVVSNYLGIRTAEGQNVVDVQGGSLGARFASNVSSHRLVSDANLIAYITSKGFTDVSNVVPDFGLGLKIEFTGGSSKSLKFGDPLEELSFTDNAVDRILITTPASISFSFIGRQTSESGIGHRELVINVPEGAPADLTTISALSLWLQDFDMAPEAALAMADGSVALAKSTIDSTRRRIIGAAIPPIPEGEGGGTQGQSEPEQQFYTVSTVFTAAKGIQATKDGVLVTDWAAEGFVLGDIIEYSVEGRGTVRARIGHIAATGTLNLLGEELTHVILEADLPAVGTRFVEYTAPVASEYKVTVTWTYAGVTHVSVGSTDGGPTIGDLPAIGIHPGAEISYAVEGGVIRTADVGEINDDGTNFIITSDAGSQIAAHNRPSVGTIITVV